MAELPNWKLALSLLKTRNEASIHKTIFLILMMGFFSSSKEEVKMKVALLQVRIETVLY